MRLTVGYTLPLIAEYVDDGSCDRKLQLKRLNEVVRTMVRFGDNDHVDRWCLNAFKGCITLPPDVDHVRKIRIEGRVSLVHTQWFEFLSGQGDSHCEWCNDGITHRGSDFQTFADLPTPMQLFAVSDRKEEGLVELFLSGADAEGQPIRNDTEADVLRMGETLDISDPNVRILTKNIYQTVTLVDKPLTRGIVRLYGHNPANDSTFLIGYYLPWETRPCYTRYEINGLQKSCPSRVTILATRKFVPLVHDDQILPVSNLEAIIDMLLAKNAQKNDKPIERREFERSARDSLKEDLENTRGSESEFDIDFLQPVGFGGFNSHHSHMR